jgi:hypothetical protein
MDFSERMSNNNFIQNPFFGGVKPISDNVYCISITPVWVDVSWFGWLGVLMPYLVWGWSNWLIFPIIIGLSGILWTKYFFFFMLKLGLKKAGYKDKIKLIHSEDIVDIVVFKRTD